MKRKSKSEAMCDSRREIILLDVDCFEVQVWCNNRPELQNVPVVVVGNSVKIISVNYPARFFGVKRSDSLEEAQRKCPGLVIVPIPDRWGKQDQRPVLQASYKIKESVKIFFRQNFGSHQLKMDMKCREEFYIDITPVVTEQMSNSNGLKLKYEDFYQKTILEDKKQILGEELKNFIHDITDKENLSTNSGLEDDNRRLLLASVIAGKLIDHLLLTTGFQTSAGVARNKLQTKLACVLNRPKSVTTILDSSLENISKRIPIENINGLGGSRGRRLKEISTFVDDENTKMQPVSTMFHLRSIPAEKLTAAFGKKFALKILEHIAGEDFEPVENRGTNKSTCNERYIFPYDSIKNSDDWNDALQKFSTEMAELLEEEKICNGIRAMKIKLQLSKMSEKEDDDPNIKFPSGSLICPAEFTRQDIHQNALKVLQNWKENGVI